MFYSQPLSTRFGTDLVSNITSGSWDRLDIAVAWVRASGMRHIEAPLKAFLASSGSLRVVVGIDLDNTSSEGLASLLALKTVGTVSLYVNHNEGGSLFHPKLYLFRNSKTNDARLIVGSNNITEAGLYRNTEAGLEVSCKATAPLIVAALSALDSWCDPSLGLSKELTPALHADLESYGYVAKEAMLRAAVVARSSAAKGAASKKLFGSVTVTAPKVQSKGVAGVGAASPSAGKKKGSKASVAPPVIAGPTGPSSPFGQVLLMRVRKASKTARATQTQIPKKVAGSAFFSGVTSVISIHDGQTHVVRPAKARGGINTLKLEIPEMRTMQNPLVRFEHTPSGVQYEAYDSGTAKGAVILHALRAGRKATPASTFLTRPLSPDSSTWWRFV